MILLPKITDTIKASAHQLETETETASCKMEGSNEVIMEYCQILGDGSFDGKKDASVKVTSRNLPSKIAGSLNGAITGGGQLHT